MWARETQSYISLDALNESATAMRGGRLGGVGVARFRRGLAVPPGPAACASTAVSIRVVGNDGKEAYGRTDGLSGPHPKPV